MRITANLIGALGAAMFARAGLLHYLSTRSLIGAAFFAEQIWVVIAYLAWIHRAGEEVDEFEAENSDSVVAF